MRAGSGPPCPARTRSSAPFENQAAQVSLRSSKGVRSPLADTIISSGLIIDGNLKADGSVRIDGQVLGRVQSSAAVELGPTSSVSADVQGQRVSVAGTVLGNVQASERVDLLSGARLTGDVRAPRLTIADGASFRGKVDMEAGHE
jgi:cytoskeletal protein CcmA (bactofilin family)